MYIWKFFLFGNILILEMITLRTCLVNCDKHSCNVSYSYGLTII